MKEAQKLSSACQDKKKEVNIDLWAKMDLGNDLEVTEGNGNNLEGKTSV